MSEGLEAAIDNLKWAMWVDGIQEVPVTEKMAIDLFNGIIKAATEHLNFLLSTGYHGNKEVETEIVQLRVALQIYNKIKDILNEQV